jgi:hypothetical protein
MELNKSEKGNVGSNQILCPCVSFLNKFRKKKTHFNNKNQN